MINTEEIVIVNTAGVLVLLVSLLSRIDNRKNRHLSDHLFDTMIGITLGALVAETASFLLDGVPGRWNYYLQYFLNAYLFLASCSVGMLWVLYVNDRIYHSRQQLRRWLLPVAVPMALIAVLLVCDLFGAGFIFSISERNVYQRGTLVALTYLIVFSDYCISLAMAIAAVRRNNHVRFFPVPYFVVPCVLGTVVQSLRYGLSVGWFCVSLAFLFVQLHLYNENAFVDELSGLYNRKYYDCVIRKLASSRKRGGISGIMLDVNRFKDINDRFGHSVGDDAIRNLGRILSEITTERNIAFRQAGDEFIILSIGASEQDVQQLMELLNHKLEAFNASGGKPYRLSLAMGYTIWEEEAFDPDTFLHRMDIQMYKSKNRFHAGKSEAARR